LVGFLFSSRSKMLPLGNRKDKTMSKKSIWISFPQGGIIPKEVLGADEDRHVEAHEAVSVPERYGRHLITDRFAVEAAPGKPASKDDKAAEKKAAAEKAAAIAAAEKDVDEAKALVENAADDAAKGEAQRLLDDVEAKLAALRA
jgi:hypothetical protein